MSVRIRVPTETKLISGYCLCIVSLVLEQQKNESIVSTSTRRNVIRRLSADSWRATQRDRHLCERIGHSFLRPGKLRRWHPIFNIRATKPAKNSKPHWIIVDRRRSPSTKKSLTKISFVCSRVANEIVWGKTWNTTAKATRPIHSGVIFGCQLNAPPPRTHRTKPKKWITEAVTENAIETTGIVRTFYLKRISMKMVPWPRHIRRPTARIINRTMANTMPPAVHCNGTMADAVSIVPTHPSTDILNIHCMDVAKKVHPPSYCDCGSYGSAWNYPIICSFDVSRLRIELSVQRSPFIHQKHLILQTNSCVTQPHTPVHRRILFFICDRFVYRLLVSPILCSIRIPHTLYMPVYHAWHIRRITINWMRRRMTRSIYYSTFDRTLKVVLTLAKCTR